MTIWKKAISAVTSAALLASLLATSAFAVKGVAPDADLTDYLNCSAAANVAVPATCSQVADGISTVTLVGEAKAMGTSSLYISASGASVIATTGDFTLAGGIVTTLPNMVVTGDTITLRSPAAPGTAVVSVFEIAAGTGIATLEGTLTITFTATSGLAVSEANSTVKLVADETCAVQTTAKTAAIAALPAAVTAGLCLTLKDANGALVAGTPSVSVTITPVGLVHANTPPAVFPLGLTGQVVSENAAAGIANFQIVNTGAVGVATIGISVTQGTTTTTFAPKTFTFTGALASITVTPVKTVWLLGDDSDNYVPAIPAIKFGGKDAAGNAVAIDVDNAGLVFDNAVVTGTAATVLAMTDSSATSTPDGQVWISCGLTAGSITLAVKVGSITSAATTIYCSDVPDTFTVAFGATVVAAGGSTTLTVKALDENGKPAAPANVTVIVSSGAISPAAKNLVNGEAVFTYLAPFNFGTVTALVTVGDLAAKSASINIGVPAVVTTLGSTASTLNVAPPGGSWSTSTKVAKVGSFITWRFAAGVANAGKTIGVFLQTRNSSGVWSAPVRFSARVADSSGNAYFSWRSSSALWVSIRGGLDAARSNPPVQGRWVN